MTKKSEREQAIQMIKEEQKMAEELKQQFMQLKELADNQFQPVPKLVQKDNRRQVERFAPDLGPTQLRVTLRGSNQLKAVDANYIKYSLPYLEGNSKAVWSNHFSTNQDEQVFVHDVTKD